jgi:alpha-glucosidase
MEVPSTWSETHFISGYPGEHVVLARRSGERWFVAGMTNEEARTVEFGAGFLPEGRYRATLWRDAPDAAVEPAHLVKMDLELDQKGSLEVPMEQGGGFVLILEPV